MRKPVVILRSLMTPVAVRLDLFLVVLIGHTNFSLFVVVRVILVIFLIRKVVVVIVFLVFFLWVFSSELLLQFSNFSFRPF